MRAPGNLPSVDGRRFAAVADTVGGEVGPETVFTYHEADGEIWAEYAGGKVRRGYLVGTRDGGTLRFRYAQLNASGETSTGRCRSQLTVDERGRLRLDQTWHWESQPGSGISSVTELD
ncbi:hypothetical protein [Microbacterium sp.]|uniref:hypothetical protein n=1 Tax=Microbacterium sp. TaxID=51671 RepID=UPI003C71164F